MSQAFLSAVQVGHANWRTVNQSDVAEILTGWSARAKELQALLDVVLPNTTNEHRRAAATLCYLAALDGHDAVSQAVRDGAKAYLDDLPGYRQGNLTLAEEQHQFVLLELR